ncbi:aminotransferase class I/II-fold pyridoxal phosphate-dependent enzyme [Francisella sp. 19X1-34]|uniref:threonine aldolase family protein n=1 Tax=Francisella sp. 19X1-34 TaxID=3087177 RepID=UPI002E34FC6C|nr:aminotransferase class I/II-fold pyridoxal phosphate-dependent enzyme [Francisella sp. 19X1-34]MED7788980.1 aminotransferase class I/II-fold pyridoxal phosphate-dependent enzyme [Francisella sp. 19X1-34]
MLKYSFMDDYSEGCHPNILRVLNDTNHIQQIAYGNDEYSYHAKKLISKHFSKDNVAIHFVAGGTLANLICISSILKPYEAVISASSGHIALREAGAIEATGHKIISVNSENGKLTSNDIKEVLKNNSHAPHMAKPKLVYISNSTELGTIYTKAELQALSKVCKHNNLLLFIDGARLGVALTAKNNDLILADIVEFADIFWIGGTKTGILFGEAIVIPNKILAEEFDFNIKQRGALLAKGRVLGLQFRELFSNNLFFELASHANKMAEKLSQGITDSGFKLLQPTQSNQIFAIFPNTLIKTLQEQFTFFIMNEIDEQSSMVRLVTSWATIEEKVDSFIREVARAK